ncbi:variable surface protein [Plasmodium gonderi]|uniref:Variable surface protein n=1 Tax=Plasmodium gonderi TaxID=77519 RepID=A0A1Y1JPQ3_PLAGO|nr:variable surface protein [Plasmodium gonderi]GAW83207.1 variable surface protein [Plasmodium gonderi]
MTEVVFEVSSDYDSLGNSACLLIYYNTKAEINKKIDDLGKLEDGNLISEKCSEIDKYLEEEQLKNSFCFKDSFISHFVDIKDKIRNLLETSNKYSKCFIKLTSSNKRHSELKNTLYDVREEDGTELDVEKGNSRTKIKSVESSNEQVLERDNYSAKTESEDTKQEYDNESRLSSTQITSESSSGANLLVNDHDSTRSEGTYEKARSADLSQNNGSLHDNHPHGQSKAERDEAQPSVPSSRNISFHDPLYVPNSKPNKNRIGIFSASFSHDGTKCENMNNTNSKSDDEEIIIIKLRNCESNDVEYEFVDAINNKTHMSASPNVHVSQNIPYTQEIKLAVSPSFEEPLTRNHTSPDEVANGEQSRSCEEHLCREGTEGTGNLQDTSSLIKKPCCKYPKTLQAQKEATENSQPNSICNESSCKESYINQEDGRNHQTKEVGTKVKTSTQDISSNDSRNGVYIMEDSILVTTETSHEIFSIRMYIVITTIIVAGILLFFLIKKKLKKNWNEYYQEQQILKKKLSLCRIAIHNVKNVKIRKKYEESIDKHK